MLLKWIGFMNHQRSMKKMSESKFEILEKRDEEQILAEAQGNIIKEMFYKFPIDGKQVTGISWVGTKEIARRYGGIKMGLPQVTVLDDQYVCSVQATDVKNDVTLIGSSMQPKNMTLKNGDIKPDRFAYVKVTSKAQRNAIRALVPETFLLEMEKTFSSGSYNQKKRSTPRYEEAEQPGEDDGSSVFDLASLNSFLLSNGAPVDHEGKALCESVDGILIVRSPAGADMYSKANLLLRSIGFEWIKGGYRWERTE